MKCKGVTAKGSKCKRDAEKGSDYCWQHRKPAVAKKVSAKKAVAKKVSAKQKSTSHKHSQPSTSSHTKRMQPKNITVNKAFKRGKEQVLVVTQRQLDRLSKKAINSSEGGLTIWTFEIPVKKHLLPTQTLSIFIEAERDPSVLIPRTARIGEVTGGDLLNLSQTNSFQDLGIEDRMIHWLIGAPEDAVNVEKNRIYVKSVFIQTMEETQ